MRKKIVALLLSAAMVATMLPAGALAADGSGDGTAEEMKLVASYDMSHEGTALKDISSGQNDAELIGLGDSDFATEDTDAVLNFPGDNQKYVALPDGLIHGEKFAVEATFKTSKPNVASWLWCLGSKIGASSNYVFISPAFWAGAIRAGIKDATDEMLFQDPGSIEANVYTKIRMEFDNGEMTLRVNDAEPTVLSTDFSVQKILHDGTENGISGYIGKSLYSGDAGFSGTMTQFDVYSLTDDNAYAKDDLSNIVIPAKTNRSFELPTEGIVNGSTISWKSDNPDVIDAEGNVTPQNEETVVTLTATATYKSGTSTREIPVTVYDKTVLVDFNFDSAEEDGSIVSENAKATGTYTLQDSYDGKALYLDGSSTNWLNVIAPDGNSLLAGEQELTISYETKVESGGNWSFFAAPNTNEQFYENEKYLGNNIAPESISVERWNNNGKRTPSGSAAKANDWVHIDVVCSTEDTVIYVNGVEGKRFASTCDLDKLFGDSAILQIGKANWKTGEYYKGWLDNYRVVNTALTQEELKPLTDRFLGKTTLADKEALAPAIEAGKAKQAEIADTVNDYTEASVTALADAIAAAEALVEETIMLENQKTIDDAVAAVNAGIEGLALKPADTKALEKAIEDAEKLNRNHYTDDSLVRFDAALEAAKALLETKPSLYDQDEVNAAAGELNAAIGELDKKPVNFADLEKAANAADAIKADVTIQNYTEASVKAFTEAIELANVYLKNQDQFTIDDQENIDALVEALNKAMEALDKEDAKKDLDAVKLPAETTEDLTLPAKGTVKESTITWKSSNTDIIADNGKVTRPVTDTTVTLTATAAYKEVTAKKDFTVKVIGTNPKKVLVDFNFDADQTGFTSENAKAEGTYTLVDGYDGKALYLDGSSSNYLKVTATDGSSLLTGAKELTVSFEVKPDRTDASWVFFAAANDNEQIYEKEKYIGSFTRDGNIDSERYNSNSQTRPAQAWTAIGSDWVHIDIVYAEAETILYVNGEEKAREASIVDIAQMLGDSSVFYIGRANWKTGEYCKGWLDNYRIVNYAVAEDDIPALSEEFLSKTAKADKTELEKAITAGNEKNKEISIYTEDTAKALTDALKTAKDLMAAEVFASEQSKVDAAAKALNDAIAGLKVKAAELTALNGSIKAAEDKLAEISVEDYTEESVKALNDALKAAKDMAAKENLTAADQKEIDAAAKALDDAVKGLERKIKNPEGSVVDVFEDVFEGEWYIEAAQYVFDRNIMTGLTDTIFGANVELSRAQFATILYRIEGEPEVSLDGSFPDVEAGSFYENAVAWASSEEVGVIKGYADGTFGPSDILTREQMVVMMYRYLEYAGVEVESGDYSQYPDADKVSPFAEEAMKWAIGDGMIKGDHDLINPQGMSARAHCATVIMRFLETYGAEE